MARSMFVRRMVSAAMFAAAFGAASLLAPTTVRADHPYGRGFGSYSARYQPRDYYGSYGRQYYAPPAYQYRNVYRPPVYNQSYRYDPYCAPQPYYPQPYYPQPGFSFNFSF